MRLIHHAADLADFHDGFFVPTMGALHRGHASLIELAAREADRTGAGSTSRAPVVVSIFVNPTQFGPGEDFARYPRTLEADLALCSASGADAVYAPSVEDVYPTPPPALPTTLPEVATLPKLEDAHRPGHFAGVCQVVRRLFQVVRPRAAVFGEKDFQQLRVIEAMVAGDGLAIRIIPGPTVREPDGLALSSRNRFLAPADRPRAAAISAALRAAAGQATPGAAEALLHARLAGAGIEPDYAVMRDSRTLRELTPAQSAMRVGAQAPVRALVAARVSGVRLLDNLAVTGEGA